MANTGPENRYIQAVGRRLPPSVYAEKTNNPYRRGTPDMYYEGNRDCLWVEYKWKKEVPKQGVSPVLLLSSLQADWLNRAFNNGRSVAVIIGTPEGGLIYPYASWTQRHTRFAPLTKQEVAEWITQMVMNT